MTHERYPNGPAVPGGEPIVGILGGMGPAASHAFLGHLINETPAGCDQDHLHIVMECIPQIPDRTAFLTGNGPDPLPMMLRGIIRLLKAGTSTIVMPCNSACAFRERLIAASGAEIVDWIAVAASSLDRGRTGILATRGTYQEGGWQRTLEASGTLAVIPCASDQERLMTVIYGRTGLKSGRHGRRELTALKAVAQALVDRGAERLLLACTELPLMMPAAAAWWPVPAVDPAIAVARHVVRQVQAACGPGRRTA